MQTEIFQNIQDFKRAVVSFFIKTQQKDIHAFDYEFIAFKCKSNNLIQFSEKKNQVTNFSRDFSFY